MRSSGHRARISRIFTVLLAGALGVAGWAQAPTPRPKAEVRAVRFNLISAPESTARWFEADVELDVRPPGGRTTFVDRVKVTLSLGTKALDGSYRFYQADAEAVSVEAGSGHFRFYLPPEIVRRDSLRPEVEFWLVEISVGGEAQAASARNYATALRDADRLASFRAKVAAEAPARSGEFLPQDLTGFAASYGGATPTMLRKSRE